MTKAKTQGERRRFHKLGRQRDATAQRDTCGRIKRPLHTERAENMAGVVVAQRRKRYGLTAQQAAQDIGGDILGVLISTGRITVDAFTAGRAYQRLAYEYHGRALNGPPSLTACPIEPRTKGHSEAPDLPREKRLRWDWDEARVRFSMADPIVRHVLDKALIPPVDESELDPRIDDTVWRVFVRGLGILMEMYQMPGEVEGRR